MLIAYCTLFSRVTQAVQNQSYYSPRKHIIFAAWNGVEMGACGFHLNPWHAWNMVGSSCSFVWDG
jgi:hypothetical protein